MAVHNDIQELIEQASIRIDAVVYLERGEFGDAELFALLAGWFGGLLSFRLSRASRSPETAEARSVDANALGHRPYCTPGDTGAATRARPRRRSGSPAPVRLTYKPPVKNTGGSAHVHPPQELPATSSVSGGIVTESASPLQ